MKPARFRGFSDLEHETWRELFGRQSKGRDHEIYGIFSTGLKALGIGPERIPELDDVNARLKALTGFIGVPVEGLEGPQSFYGMLARREFPIGNFIRDPKDLSYTPAPDIFHDLYGHIPFFADPDYADFCFHFGQATLPYHDRPAILRQYERFFWFTVEFGLVETPEGRRVFGAGIASSFGETKYALSEKPEVVPFDVDVIRCQEFRIDVFQERLFLLKNAAQLYGSLGQLKSVAC